MSRPAMPESETPLVKRLREVAGGADTEFGEDARLMREAATALALSQTEIKGHMRVEDELRAELKLGPHITGAAPAYTGEGVSMLEVSSVAHVNPRKGRAAIYERAFQLERELALAQARIAELEKDRDSWKQESEMMANAWQRELCDQGILYRPKTHWIDFMVLATRKVMALAKENGISCCDQPELCAKTDCNKLLRFRLDAALKSRA